MRNQDKGIQKLGQAWVALADRRMEREGCLETDEIWDAVRGKLPPRQTRRIVDHLACCPVCSEAWQLGRQFNSEAELPLGVHLLPRRRPRWAARAAWGSVAATVLLAIALQVGTDLISPASPGFRAPVGATIHSLLPEDEALPRDRFSLRWMQVAVAEEETVHYSLIVTTESLQVIAEVDGILETHYQVPQKQLRELESGTELRWQVHATLDGGRRLSSQTFSSKLQ